MKAAPKKAAPKVAKASPGQTPAKPTARFETTDGTLTCELFPDKTPNAVANFVGLATGTKDWTDPKTGLVKHGVPLYDGTIFHRVIPEFMIQGGDPAGTGAGDIGFTIKDELLPDLKFDQPGRLAYANRGPNTSSSQFFITEVPYPSLDPCLDPGGCTRGMRHMPQDSGYVIFGQCTPESVDLVKKIAREPRGLRDRPDNPVTIQHVAISGIPMKRPTARPIRKAGAKASKAVPKQ